MESSGGEATSLDTGDPRLLCAASKFVSLRKAWGRAPIPVLPWNLGCIISLTATRHNPLRDYPSVRFQPFQGRVPSAALIPPQDYARVHSQASSAQVPPKSTILQSGGAESYLLSCSFKRPRLLPFRSRRLTRDDSSEFGMSMQIRAPSGPMGSGGAGTADQCGGGAGAHHIRSGLAIKGNIVSLYMGGRVGGSLRRQRVVPAPSTRRLGRGQQPLPPGGR